MFVCSDGKKLRLVSGLDHVAISGKMAFDFETRPSTSSDVQKSGKDTPLDTL